MTPNIQPVTVAPPQPPVLPLAEQLLALLRAKRLRLDTEAAVQAAVAALIAGAGIPHIRGPKVTGGRIDFLCGPASALVPHAPGVGIDVEVRGGRRAIQRQCAQYCQDTRIGHLIIVTGMAMPMPRAMNGKPISIIGLAGGAL